MKNTIIPLLILLGALLTNISCSKKDPAELETGQWVERNDKCALEAIRKTKEQLDAKIKKSEEILKQIQAELLKGNCPLAQNPECIPEVGVQAIATYISSASSRSVSNSKDSIIEDENTGSIVDELNQFRKTKVGKKSVGKTREKKEEKPVEVKKEVIPVDLTAELLEKKSLCSMKVDKNCQFQTLDKIIARLIIVANQMRNYETEIRNVLNITGVKPESERIYSFYQILKTIESTIPDLVTREIAAKKNYKTYGIRYEAVMPLRLKGMLINITAAIPSAITSMLRKYGANLKSSEKIYVTNREGYKSALRAQSRKLGRDKRMNANHCLDMKGCWNFRTCLNRFQLPGILLFKNIPE
ncbi:hypothetical protein KKF34_13140 [Myxococcota bacterium]|nr:hypothetical protein [Myxococcota bacterium]MBU1381912.1 hypothetical protein [Myxococcota bacterium]MBU1497813.1 hypothetical protein [Myxococcota bacterium]